MTELRINYTKVISQANQIDSLASDLRVQYNNLNTLSSNMKSAWKGEAATVTSQQIELTKNSMLTEIRRIENLANTIKTVANIIKTEDERRAAEAATLNIGF